MKKLDVNFKNGYIALSQKIIFSFDPPAYGIIERNIFTGDYRIVGGSRTVPLTFEQGENLIESDF
ncbi:MAG: hypothetical protein U0L11_10485 [Acutalibacteraceae bacterium]|nr:hypothetical protein [Acutalibacteraceae bacterium]